MKGRAAAAQAAKILRKVREQLRAKASAKLNVIQEHIKQEETFGKVADSAAALLDKATLFSGTARTHLELLLTTARLKLPEEDQQWLPGHSSHTSFLRNHLLVAVWLALLVHIGCRLLGLGLRIAFRSFVVWPSQCLWMVCRRLLCCLCPCRRKPVQKQAAQGVHANGHAEGYEDKSQGGAQWICKHV